MVKISLGLKLKVLPKYVQYSNLKKFHQELYIDMQYIENLVLDIF